MHAVLPPVAVGSHLSVAAGGAAQGLLPRRNWPRRARCRRAGSAVLRALVEARLSFLISGGTGTRQDDACCPPCSAWSGTRERIVLAEDSAELRPDHPHVVRLEGRPANQEGAGLVTLQDLVRQALRMRPDRLVVGEVRGPEVDRAAGRLEHRARGRLRDRACQCGGRRARPAGGPGDGRGTRPGSAAQPVGGRALGGDPSRTGPGPGGGGSPRCMCWSGTPSGLVVPVPALRWGAEAFAYERGWPRLLTLLGGAL